MAIRYSRIECELREVVLKDKPAEMLEASPKGTVPVLIDSDHVVDESIDVMAWALGKSDPDDWLSHALDHELILRSDNEFKFNLDRYKYFDRYSSSEPEQTCSWYFERALLFLKDLETSLVADAEGQFFLESAKLTALDIAIFPFVRQFAFVDKPRFDTQELPKLQAWLAFLIGSSLFLEVMAKYPAWQSNQEDCTLFGT